MGNICNQTLRIPIAKSNSKAFDIVKKYSRLYNLNNRNYNKFTENSNIEISNLDKQKDEIKYNIIKSSLTKSNTKDFFIINTKYNLYLCKQSIVELNSSIAILKEVKVLQLCCNFLHDLPTEIGDMRNLIMLNLSHNEIYKIPKEIGNLKKLKELNLGYNNLNELPYTITSLKKLENLNIQNNKFNKLPQYLGRLDNLRILNISKNNINSVPVEILNISPLLEFYHFECPFKKPEDKIQKFITLQECCARQIMNKNLPLPEDTPQLYINMFLSMKECTFCSKVTFSSTVIYTFMNFYLEKIPAEYTLCKKHFKNNIEKIQKIFTTVIDKSHLNRKIISLYDLINPYNYDSRYGRIFKKNNKNLPYILLSHKYTNFKLELFEEKYDV